MATWPKSYGDVEDAGELERRRYAVENAIGTLRIEGMEMPACGAGHYGAVRE